MDCSTPGLPVPHHLLKFAQVHVHFISDVIQPSHPLMPYSPSASIFPSIREFSNELPVCIRWLKYWSFSFSISPSNKYSGLISLKINWFDLLAVQGTQDSSPASQFEGINSLVLSQPYVTPGKTIALTLQTSVNRVMSLPFSTLSRFVIAFLPRGIIFWFQGYSHHLQWF